MPHETEKDERTLFIDEHYYPVCWCWMGQPTPFWVTVFGGILVVIGGIWLLTTLELLPKLYENALGPVIGILVGLAYLVNSIVRRK